MLVPESWLERLDLDAVLITADQPLLQIETTELRCLAVVACLVEVVRHQVALVSSVYTGRLSVLQCVPSLPLAFVVLTDSDL